jgi:hypothetical protein
LPASSSDWTAFDCILAAALERHQDTCPDRRYWAFG